ncbi:hypothetical protein [Alkalihalobacterium sp. APHAB7]|uniref:hypothetical protein n=1 Tax=Alkalihalobacterium sp. APHAB7 TaxID=3402081 RepID=UPI003AAC1DE7
MASSIFLNRVKRCEKLEVLMDEINTIANIIIKEHYREREISELIFKMYILSKRAKELHEIEVNDK